MTGEARPVAVIGVACRLPGAPDPAAFWTLLREGRSAIRPTPPERATAPDVHPGAGFGGYLDDLAGFDPEFFGISPLEAAAMDPQQRLVLELAWETLEDAGIPPATLRESGTGVFVGGIADEYAALSRRARIGRHTLTGTTRGIIANRVSYALGLTGPSLTVDAAQSSSLVAVHLACQSLRRGESDLALAGGVNLIVDPDGTEAVARFGGLSPDGRCYPFDRRANGYVRGEGAALTLLKPLDAALADGDHVYAVILGGAVNNDGTTGGLTVPSAHAQAEVIRRACADAGVRPADLRYVELHGTGTPVGDPIEARGLGLARGDAPTLQVGSVKTNVGHLEGAAGITGLLKTILSIDRRHLPATLNHSEPHPAIDLDALRLAVRTEGGPWPDGPLLAGVSSWGMGGTNCHLVLTSAPPREASSAPARTLFGPQEGPLLLSARTPGALRGQAARLRDALDGQIPGGLGLALATTRTAFGHRAALLGDPAQGLQALATGRPAPGVRTGRATGGPVAVLFPGQGSQKPGMGSPAAAYREAFAEVAELLDARLPQPIGDLIDGPAETLGRTAFTQPALFAVEVAAYRLLRSLGVEPAFVAGHSIGEVAAAHAAGVLDLESAAELIVARGRLMDALPEGGAMLALGTSEAHAVELIGDGNAAIAAVNGPEAVVVSGEKAALEEIAARATGRGLRTRRLEVSHAFHSPLMEPMLAQFRTVLEGLRYGRARIPFVSTVTGEPIETTGPDYWVEHARRPVRFADGLARLRDLGANVFVEAGPGAVLSGLGKETTGAAFVPLLGRDGDPAAAVAGLFTAGVPLDWNTIYAPGGTRVPLPTYAFQREPYWLDTPGPQPRPADPVAAQPGSASQARPADPGAARAGAAPAPSSSASRTRPADAGAARAGAASQTEPGAAQSGAAPAPSSFASRTRPAGLGTDGPAAQAEPGAVDLGVEARILGEIAAALGHADPARVDRDATFQELGLDSLGLVGLRERLGEILGVDVPAAALYAHPTTDALIGHLRGTPEPAEPAADVRRRADAGDPVVIVGMGCRYPGADSPDELWDLVAEGRDVIGDFPEDRGWDLENLVSATRRGGFLRDAAAFDSAFFGISPREALAIDPQQRLLLQTAWEALERAGIDPLSLKDSDTGVFIGATTSDYTPRLYEDAGSADGYLLTGGTMSVASGRIAYVLGLRGPALTVDTACSSSLVALDLAVRALRSGEVDLALAGGAAVMASPGMFVEFSRQRGLSEDGRCKAFGAGADGTGWAEGVGVLVVERLSRARELGHHVLAVIAGSAVNQDGASNGLTAPNGRAQEQVITRALADAGLRPSEVDAVEAHGTGTTLGDPIEAHALIAAYGHDRDTPLLIGSLKSNLGHSQAAAGVGGIIKMVQALRHGVLPRTLHADDPSPHIPWQNSGIALLTEHRAWPDTGRPRRAAVSSFGISGTNAHLILEQPPNPPEEPPTPAPTPPLLLSAADPTALSRQATTLATHLSRQATTIPTDPSHQTAPAANHPDAHPPGQTITAPASDTPTSGQAAAGEQLDAHPSGQTVTDLASGTPVSGQAAAGEQPDAHSSGQAVANPASDTSVSGQAAVVAERLDARAGLGAVAGALLSRARLGHGAAVLAEERGVAVEALRALAAGEPHPEVLTGERVSGRTVFVFPGQGSQWAAMARELLESDPVFRDEIQECADAFAEHVDWSLPDVLRGRDGAPSLERVDVVQPVLFAVMAGLAATWRAAGVVPDAVVGHSQGEIAAAYAAGALSLADAARLITLRSKALTRIAGDGGMASVALPAGRLDGWLDGLEIAVRNGPRSTVVAGPARLLDRLLERAEREGVRARRIPVDYASHTTHVEPLREELLETFAALAPRPATTAFCSAVTGDILDTATLDAAYWYRNLRETVRFEDAVRHLIDTGHRRFVEVSPHPVLTFAIEEILADRAVPGAVHGTLRRDQGGPRQLRRALAAAHLSGASVSWPRPAADPALPTYPFARDRYWLTPSTRAAATGHPLIETVVSLADGGLLLTGRIDPAAQPWLADHAVLGSPLVPGTVLAELAAYAGARAAAPEVAELTVRAPLPLGPVRLQLLAGPPDPDGHRPLDLHARPSDDDPWTLHASGTLAPAATPSARYSGPGPDATPVDLTDVYDRLFQLGYDYGPAFQGLTAAWRSGQTLYAELTGPGGEFDTHPALLDAALHPIVAGLLNTTDGPPLLPFAFEGLRLDHPVSTTLRVRIDPLTGDRYRLLFADADGTPTGQITSLAFRPLTPRSTRPLTHRLAWDPLPPAPTTPFTLLDGPLTTLTNPSPTLLIPLGLTTSTSPTGQPILSTPTAANADDRLIQADANTSGQPGPADGSPSGQTGTSADGLANAGVNGTDPASVDTGGQPVLSSPAGDGPANAGVNSADPVGANTGSRPVLAHPAGDGRLVEVARERVAAVLGLVQEALGGTARLVFAVGEDDLASAPVRGLVRTAAAEHPGRFGVVVVRGEAPAEIVAADYGEPEVAVRDGKAFGRRLTVAEDEGEARPVPEGTVLITGGTGGLGGLVARRFAAAENPPHLLLASRSGITAPGAPELAAELTAAGAVVTIAACDVTDRAALERLLGDIPRDQPLRAVVHTAGVLDDATVANLTGTSLTTALRPKADAAWHLHELTLGLPLERFDLFSSAVATLGVPGQANYAAGNAFLDALAEHRHRLGLPALSLAWGLWDETSAMTGHLTDADRTRLARLGVGGIGTREALDVLERATGPYAFVSPLDEPLLREEAAAGRLPALFSRIVRRPGRARQDGRQGERGAWARRLLAERPGERQRTAVALLREQVAAVLGHADPATLGSTLAFKDLGFDSLTAVELRARLTALTGLNLPATIVFEFPTITQLADHLTASLLEERPGTTAPTTIRDGNDSDPVEPGEPDDPVVIVGMGCRYPGGVASPDDLWDLVTEGRDVIGDFPDDRGWNVEALFHPDPDHRGTSTTRRGGFLRDAAEFDAAFFGMSPREALATDPQHRLLLQTAWEALERAGIDPLSLKDSDTGVFIGAMYDDYAARLRTAPEDLEGLLLAGNQSSVASGRIAYVLGLRGPALTVDTACSSSLVALDLAVRAVRSGEVGLALAGGVAVMASPGIFVEFSRQRGLSTDGRCKAFGAGADGTGWSEGVGVLVVERLSRARELGHRVLAVVAGLAVNQDGASNGLTAPNGRAQEQVITRALADARLAPGDVDAVEAHGTGTRLGDPIEAHALIAAYGHDRDTPLLIGSLKSNLGHSQAAAGVGGIIKMVQALHHGVLPRTLHAEEPSPHVAWEDSVALLTEQTAWPDTGRPRRAGVSSFGISGTNAHVILEQAPPEPEEPDTTGGVPGPLVLSARSEAALRAQAAALHTLFSGPDAPDPADAALTLARRGRFPHRAVVEPGPGLLPALAALRDGQPHPLLVTGVAHDEQRLAALFSGQGSQRAGMALDLLATSPRFAETFQEIDSHFDLDLRALLADDTGLLHRTRHAQPALFAVEVALYRLAEHHGLRPDFLIGHSIGELAAAHVAGVLDLADACALVAARGRLMDAARAGGAMAAFQGTEQELTDLAAGTVDLAAVNGPHAVVLSGDADAIDGLVGRWKATGRRATRLKVSHAFHSSHLDDVLEEFHQIASGLSFHPARLPIISTVTGAVADPRELSDPAYWSRQIRRPVRFADAVRTARRAGVDRFVELGPDGTLASHAAEDDAIAVPVLRPGHPETQTFREALARLHTSGVPVDHASLTTGARLADLPTYPFQTRRYWLLPDPAPAAPADLGLEPAPHPMLGGSADLPDGGRLFTGVLSTARHPWLADHRIGGRPLAPAALLAELALAAGAATGLPRLSDLTLDSPIPLDEEVTLQLVLTGSGELTLRSRRDGAWSVHATATLDPADPAPAVARIPAAPGTLAQGVHAALAEHGYGYGPAFQGLTAAWTGEDGLYAEATLPVPLLPEAARHLLHPALLDAALHVLPLHTLDGPPQIPYALEGVSLHTAHATSVRARLTPLDATSHRLELTDPEGTPVLTIDRLRLRPLPTAARLYELQWHPTPPPTTPTAPVTETATPPDAPTALTLLQTHLTRDTPDPLLLKTHTLLTPSTTSAQDQPHSLVPGKHQPAHDVPAGAQSTATDADPAQDQTAHDDRGDTLEAGAQSPAAGEEPDDGQDRLVGGESVEAAAIWGLVGAAQAEHPGRFLLVDGDGGVPSGASRALVREGGTLVPRLVPVPVEEETGELWPRSAAGGTVLVAGGTGAVGRAVARHLVTAHGVGNLLLVSRRGADHPDAAGIAGELSELGARVVFAALDLTDREALAGLLDGVPLTGVIHAAGITGDATIARLDPETLRRVIAVKAGSARHLDALTRGRDLDAFVAFGSVAGVIGTAGQGAYGAANAALEAVVRERRLAGERAVTVHWGLWDLDAGMAADLSARDLARLAEAGIRPMREPEALTLLDAALAANRPALVAAHLDRIPAPFTTADTIQPRQATIVDAAQPWQVTTAGPAHLRQATPVEPVQPWQTATVAPAQPGQAATAGTTQPWQAATAEPTWPRQAAAGGTARPRQTERLVLATLAAVLGHDGIAEIDPERGFAELGIDSLTAVELRNRLSTALGVRLPGAIVFDHPTPQALIRHLDGLDALGGHREEEPGEPHAPADDPIVIVGMACRFPGGVRTPDGLWELLESGRDAITPFPDDRGWDPGLYDPDPERTGTSTTRHGGFLHDAAEFDPEFFGISPREALAIDPQQRLLLQTAWEAVEDAGIDPASLRGSQSGVFVGVMYSDYGARVHQRPGAARDLEGYLVSGSAGSVASGRISYTLGLEGPAVTVDTACSSSLVAVHQAAQALRLGECSLALVGGATVMASPATFVEFSRQRGLAPDGRCKPFSAAADGTAWAEGAGLLVLQRLSDARRDGRRILAVVRGSAVNQDGASNGLTAPNGPSQERVIRSALRSAGLRPRDVDVLEAHGTGTRLGDPIEATAVLNTYGGDRDGRSPLLMGSVKSNLGHTQAAAGVAGIIKTVLAMRHGRVPANLHLDGLTEHADWSAGTVTVPAATVPWPQTPGPRRAAVSSFGIGGTNAHVVLEQGTSEPPRERHDDGSVLPWVLSARTEDGLREQAARLRDRILADPEVHPADVAYALATTRTAFDHRAVIVGRGRQELLAGLESFLTGTATDGFPLVVSGTAARGATAVLFTGQGSQRAGMAAGLHAAFPVYARAFDEVAAAFRAQDGLDVAAVIADPGLVGQTRYTQAALFTVEVALFRLLESLGLRAELLAGHSIGELAAAHLSGALGLADAVALVALRGRLMQDCPEGGLMHAVQADPETVRAVLAETGASAGLAAVNGHDAVVVSGDADAVTTVTGLLRERGHRVRRLEVSHAFHSAHMDPAVARFRAQVDVLATGPMERTVVSTLTGHEAGPGLLGSGAHWADQVRGTVQFAAALERLRELGAVRFLEVGPDAALTALVRQADDQARAHAALDRRRPDFEAFWRFVAGAFVTGADWDWRALLGPDATAVPLPTYPFRRDRLWLMPPAGDGTAAGIGADDPGHPLLAASVTTPDAAQTLYTGVLSHRRQPWLADHALRGVPVLPAAALADLTGWLAGRHGHPAVRELTLHAPILITPEEESRLRVTVTGPDVQIHARPADTEEWTLHAEALLGDAASGLGDGGAALGEAAPGLGVLRDDKAALDDAAPGLGSGGAALGDAAPGLGDGKAVLRGGEAAFAWVGERPADASSVDVSGLYPALAGRGYDYGPAFQGLRALWRAGAELHAEIDTGDDLVPGLIDAAFHAWIADGDGPLQVPYSFRDLRIQGTPRGPLRVRLRPTGPDAFALDAVDPHGHPVFSAGEVRVRQIAAETLLARRSTTLKPYEVAWVEARPKTTPLGRTVVLGAPIPGLALEAVPVPDGTEAVIVVAAPEGGIRESVLAVRDLILTLPEHARLVVLTRDAIAVTPGDPVTGAAQAALWGLVRTAQQERPTRVGIVDADTHPSTLTALPHLLSTAPTQLALRTGTPYHPRLRPFPPSPTTTTPGTQSVRPQPATSAAERGAQSASPAAGTDRGAQTVLAASADTAPGAQSAPSTAGSAPGARSALPVAEAGLGAPLAAELGEGTVLVTGAGGALGAAVARHLAGHRLLLVSRRGGADPGLAALGEELGAEVAACDLADAGAVAGLVRGRTLSAVIHSAGVLADAVLDNLTEDDLDRVLRPKTDAAWNLHRLTEGQPLRAFVLFSSIAGVVGNAGQAAYAAANAALDALAQQRRAAGLPAVSLAWGPWEDGMAATLDPAARARIDRLGIRPLAAAEGLGLFDLALGGPALAVAARLAPTASPGLPEILADLAPARPEPRREPLATRIAGLTEEAALDLVRETVSARVAEVLGLAGPGRVQTDRGLFDLGLDSLTAVELRNRLSADLGERLPTTVLFDQPTVRDLSSYLLELCDLAQPGPADRGEARTGRTGGGRYDQAVLDSWITAAGDDGGRDELARALKAALAALGTPAGADDFGMDSASDDELFGLLDRELSD